MTKTKVTAPARICNRNLFSARGVNGIDGTLGTAIGIAHQSNQPTFLLTGELAFLHDSNALLFASELIGSLTVLLINNQGGGIFENLAVANLPEFEKCFATPQTCDFAKLCAAHSVEYLLLQGENELISHCLLYTSPSPRDQRGSRMPSSA